jgi:hypothetical protein
VLTVIPLQQLRPGQVLCLDRKIHANPIQDRQAAFVNTFGQGCDGATVSYQEALLYPSTHAWCIRGMKFTQAVNTCWQTGRTFFYIDNGYIGNIGRKSHFRIVKNHVHDIRPVIDRDGDRLQHLHYENQLKNFSSGRKILLAPPSEKSFRLWNINQSDWIDQTMSEIRSHTDRPIEIRLKRNRHERMAKNTMAESLADDTHCLVTYNSVAAVEAVMLGKPAICLGPNAATVVANTSLSQIENLNFPTQDEREAWLRHLSYSQFTFEEMSNGTAWRILNP